MKFTNFLILIFLIGTFHPVQSFAQNQTYNPNINLGSNGGSYGGLKFNGVSSSVLNCTNLTQKAAVAIGGLTDKFKKNDSCKEGDSCAVDWGAAGSSTADSVS